MAVKILIADDDRMARRLLESTLSAWGYEVVAAADGRQAWSTLQSESPPPAAILDWTMPGMTGIEVCRQARAAGGATSRTYLVMVTARSRTADIVAALDAGADDFITKPFAPEELRARVQVGERIITLQQSLAERVRTLEAALEQVKQLQGLLPICAYCKRVRNDQRYWQQIELYIAERSQATFSHGICPQCREQRVEPELRKWRERRAPIR
jgi:sigma-B regulation protein RsbU (phosphoserine phosphatase)